MPVIPSVFTQFLVLTKALEGVCTWMYPDRRNLVTTGVGNLIDPVGIALKLPWFQKMSGDKATEGEVRSAWLTVKNSGMGLLGGGDPRIMALTTTRLLESDVDKLVAVKVQENERALSGRFPKWETLPLPAQVGTHMLAWAVGVAAITTPGDEHYPLFAAALEREDFVACGRECVLRGAEYSRRNLFTASQFLDAAKRP